MKTFMGQMKNMDKDAKAAQKKQNVEAMANKFSIKETKPDDLKANAAERVPKEATTVFDKDGLDKQVADLK